LGRKRPKTWEYLYSERTVSVMARRRVVLAAGIVALRGASASLQVLMVHRPKYDDWVLPKGHVEPGESLLETAFREFHEETGYQATITAKIATVDYLVKDTIKRVHWFLGEVPFDAPDEVLNPAEVAAVEWVGIDDAMAKLTYTNEREVLQKALRVR